MERLTKNINGMVWFASQDTDLWLEPYEMSYHDNRIAIEKLAAYEDTGFTPEEVATFPYRKEFAYADYMKELFPKMERAEELSAADKEERLVVLPCPLGTTVYILTAVVSRGFPDPIIETVIREETFSYQHIGMSPRYLFLTYAEAEAALKKRKE